MDDKNNLGGGLQPLRVLWVLPKYPTPISDGARHASCVLIKSLVKLGVLIDVVILDQLQGRNELLSVKEELGVHGVFLFPRKAIPKGTIGRILEICRAWFEKRNLPFTVLPFASKAIAAMFQAMFEGRVLELQRYGVLGDLKSIDARWHVILYDGLHGAAHMFDGKRCVVSDQSPPVYYRAHNVEADIWAGKAARMSESPLATIVQWQSLLMREFELSVLRKVREAFPVSEVDVSRLKELLPRLSAEVIPIGFRFPAHIPQRSPRKGHFVFVGRLDWEPNREGLIWFLTEVWPEVIARNPDVSFDIVGQGESGYLRKFSSLTGVSIRGYVDSLEDVYAEAQASIVPVFLGSGTRVKVVEAASFGCPVISTPLGVAGLHLLPEVTYFSAESLADWVTRFTRTSEREFQKVAEAAFTHLQQFADPSESAQKLYCALAPEAGLSLSDAS
ncbi:MAG: glycosyltransferase [Bdellovibrionales bacterium]|nr:glycosyltransferase [Bdellovibrionales bacterium]